MDKNNRFYNRIDPAHVSLMNYIEANPEQFPMIYDVMRDKYLQPGELTFDDMARRVVNGVYENDASIAIADAFDAIQARLWMPAGRIMAGAGTAKRVTLMNCLSGTELLYTKEYGIISLKEAAAYGECSVLTKAGWILSEVRAFGIQRLNKITLGIARSRHRRKVVHATPDHRWLTPGGETTSLCVGQTVLSCVATPDTQSSAYIDGMFHGIIFGDGHLSRQTLREVSGGYPLGTFHHDIRACGRVQEHYSLLDRYCKNYTCPPAANGDRVYYHHGEQNLKEVPTSSQLNNPDYIAGFIDGWWVADGHVTNTSRGISSTNYAHLDWLIQYAPLGGYLATGDKIIGKKVTNLGVAKDPCRCVSFQKPNKWADWQVLDIEPAESLAVVYCAVVPGEHAFTLAEGLYTGNCYATGKLEDSMEGIMREHTNFALTMQQGGGDGMDISPVRPEGAVLKRTGTAASGPMPFLHMWNSMCETIRSAGDRRGAMMVTMADTHPDLIKFITAKQTKGVLKNFNMSILVSDAFMAAKDDNEEWLLHFNVDTAKPRSEELQSLDFIDDNGNTQYVYAVWNARELWELITKATYEYSEPGVIFIDRVNELNNLWYCEEIRASNPCGEQPLPPHGACNLGHINLAPMIKNPFSTAAVLDWNLLREIVHIGVRFLDNVLDVTGFPLPEQAEEAANKRRIGLGDTGLADALIMLGMRYGSHEAQLFVDKLQEFIKYETYFASAVLAEERGPFPLFDADKWLSGRGIAGNLSKTLRQKIAKTGIRNGVLNTMAPCGTSSIAFFNPCSGIEPMFSLVARRKVRQADDSFKSYNNMNYVSYLYLHMRGNDLNQEVAEDQFPAVFVTTKDLNIHDHVLMQSKIQAHVDAAVSKTINVPKEFSYEQFVQVYDLAYATGCKGCTTYRPSDVRGSILEDANANANDKSTEPEKVIVGNALVPRPKVLQGVTHQIKWPNHGAAYYLTVNFDPETMKPYEMFITSKDGSHSEWTTALSLMVTAIFRKGGDTSFISHELKQIQSFRDGAFVEGRYVGSLPALIGRILETHLGTSSVSLSASTTDSSPEKTTPFRRSIGETCPRCNEPTLIMEEGCFKCTECFYSKCG